MSFYFNLTMFNNSNIFWSTDKFPVEYFSLTVMKYLQISGKQMKNIQEWLYTYFLNENSQLNSNNKFQRWAKSYLEHDLFK